MSYQHDLRQGLLCISTKGGLEIFGRARFVSFFPGFIVLKGAKYESMAFLGPSFV